MTGKSGQLPSSDRMPRPQTDLPMGTMAGRAAPAVPKCKQGGEGEGEEEEGGSLSGDVSRAGSGHQVTSQNSEAASLSAKQPEVASDKNQQRDKISRSISKEEGRSASQESGASSPTTKQTKKTTPSVQKTYFSKLVSIQKQPDPKPLIKRAPSDTDKGRREAGSGTPKTPRRRKTKEVEANQKKEVTPPYVKKKDPSKIREEAKSWLEGELTRIKCKEQNDLAAQSEPEKPETTRKIEFKFTCPALKKSVEIATSHSNWEKMPLVRQKSDSGKSEEEVWSISLSLSPGSHSFKYLVDGEWCTDPALPTLADSSGDVNNVIEVEPDPLDFVRTFSPLTQLTAGRARAPQRRPPSSRFLRKKLEEGDLTPSSPEEEEVVVEAVVGKIQISLSSASVAGMTQPGKVASPKTAELKIAEQAPPPPDDNVPVDGGKASQAAETVGGSVGKGGEKEAVPSSAGGLETSREKKEGQVTSEVGGKNEVSAGVLGSKAEASCSDAGIMGNGKSAAKGGTIPFDSADNFHAGSSAESELISTVNENIKKVRIDPRYQADSRTQLLIKEVLTQVEK